MKSGVLQVGPPEAQEQPRFKATVDHDRDRGGQNSDGWFWFHGDDEWPPYQWVRFNSILHRLLKRLGQVSYHASLMYIDDSLCAAPRSTSLPFFAMNLVFLRLLGVPISW